MMNENLCSVLFYGGASGHVSIQEGENTSNSPGLLARKTDHFAGVGNKITSLV